MKTTFKHIIKVASALAMLIIILSGCIVVDNTPGPYGRDGAAFFGIDYDYAPPYSYWDNNPAIPLDPRFGFYYPTAPGIYEFEYFINRYEYWYGTYEIWINRGGPGGPNGERGPDGLDSYLLLLCDPYGYHEYRTNGWYGKNEQSNSDEPTVIEKRIGEHNYRIKIQKGDVRERPAKQPKYNSKKAS